MAQLAAKWLAEHVDANLAQRTRKDYRCHYRERIGPRLGSRRVAKLPVFDGPSCARCVGPT